MKQKPVISINYLLHLKIKIFSYLFNFLILNKRHQKQKKLNIFFKVKNEAEASRSIQIPDQSGLHSKFHASQGYIMETLYPNKQGRMHEDS